MLYYSQNHMDQGGIDYMKIRHLSFILVVAAVLLVTELAPVSAFFMTKTSSGDDMGVSAVYASSKYVKCKKMYKKILKQKSVWMDYFVTMDPAPYVSRISCPFLALNGSLDTQVLPEYNLDRIQALCPSADCRLYPGLNHLFQPCETGLSAEYAQIEQTMSDEVIADIVAWIQRISD